MKKTQFYRVQHFVKLERKKPLPFRDRKENRPVINLVLCVSDALQTALSGGDCEVLQCEAAEIVEMQLTEPILPVFG